MSPGQLPRPRPAGSSASPGPRRREYSGARARARLRPPLTKLRTSATASRSPSSITSASASARTSPTESSRPPGSASSTCRTRSGGSSSSSDRRFCDAAARHLCGLDTSPGYDHPLWHHWRDASSTMMQRQDMGPMWLPRGRRRAPASSSATSSACTPAATGSRMQLVDRRFGAARVRAVMEHEVADRPGARAGAAAASSRPSRPSGAFLPARVEHRECIHLDPAVRHCCYDIYYDERVIDDPVVELEGQAYVRATPPRPAALPRRLRA